MEPGGVGGTGGATLGLQGAGAGGALPSSTQIAGSSSRNPGSPLLTISFYTIIKKILLGMEITQTPEPEATHQSATREQSETCLPAWRQLSEKEVN